MLVEKFQAGEEISIGCLEYSRDFWWRAFACILHFEIAAVIRGVVWMSIPFLCKSEKEAHGFRDIFVLLIDSFSWHS